MTETASGVTRREALKRGIVVGGAAVAWATPATSAFALSPERAQPTSAPPQGCTPGYWKNHRDAWAPSGVGPDDPVSDWFEVPDCELIAPLFGVSMIEALRFRGGSSLAGKTEILLRAAVASLVNSLHPGIGGFYGSNLIPEVASVLTSPNGDDPCALDKDAIIALATSLDRANNAGCPL